MLKQMGYTHMRMDTTTMVVRLIIPNKYTTNFTTDFFCVKMLFISSLRDLPRGIITEIDGRASVYQIENNNIIG